MHKRIDTPALIDTPARVVRSAEARTRVLAMDARPGFTLPAPSMAFRWVGA